MRTCLEIVGAIACIFLGFYWGLVYGDRFMDKVKKWIQEELD